MGSDGLWHIAGSRPWSRTRGAVPNRGTPRRTMAIKVPTVAWRLISQHLHGNRPDSWHQPRETLRPAMAVPGLPPNRTATSSLRIDPLTFIPPVARRARAWFRVHAMADHADTVAESRLGVPCHRIARGCGGTKRRSLPRAQIRLLRRGHLWCGSARWCRGTGLQRSVRARPA